MENSAGGGGKNRCSTSLDHDLPPGFRFDPTDEELVGFFLTNKVLDCGRRHSWVCDIPEVDLHRCEPWDLPGVGKRGEKDRYYFGLRDRKYPTGTRSNRATEAGYWKATGKDRCIFNSQCPNSGQKQAAQLMGLKKTLVFYAGRAPRGQKTNWVMHEYSLAGNNGLSTKTRNAEWVLCRVFQKISRRNDHAAILCPSPSKASLSSSRNSSTELLIHDQPDSPKPALNAHAPSASRTSSMLRRDELQLLMDSWLFPGTANSTAMEQHIQDIKPEVEVHESLRLISPSDRLNVSNTDQQLDFMPTLIQSDSMGSNHMINMDQLFAFQTQYGAELDNLINSVIPV